jgi:hypothetical protein
LEENINTAKENTEAILLEVNKETGLKLKAKLNCAEAKYADWPKNQLTGSKCTLKYVRNFLIAY